MTLDGDDVVKALKDQNYTVTQETYTKWLLPKDLFEEGQLSVGSLAFAGFAAERPFDTFNKAEVEKISELLKTSQKSQGVPLSWDLVSISKIHRNAI